MVVAIRRLFWLAILGGAGFAGWSVMQRRRQVVAPTAAPFEPRPPADDISMAFTELDDESSSIGDETSPWVAPTDGSCPDGYPIKANANSGIYHVPGGRFYDRTVPERCYAQTADAEADGYRRAKA